jgi:hypothetical protein
MALGHAGMTWEALLSQQVATYRAVFDVRFLTATVDAGRIALVYANVVQHGSLLQELHVDGQFLVLTNYLQAPVSHLSAMQQ